MLEWDGETPEAQLHVNGRTLTGKPRDVDVIFQVLCALRDEAQSKQRRLDRLYRAISEAMDPKP